MIMRAYSSYDLLGKQLGVRNYEGTDLVSRFFDWVEKRSNTVSIEIEVPSIVYLKTEAICESMNEKLKDYDVTYYAAELVGNIYSHFIKKAFNNKNGFKHAYDIISKFKSDSSLVIHNHLLNEKVTFKKSWELSLYTDKLSLTKKEIRKGELLLMELDQLYGHDFTVEILIQCIWMDFINDRKNSSEKKIIEEIGDILEEL